MTWKQCRINANAGNYFVPISIQPIIIFLLQKLCQITWLLTGWRNFLYFRRPPRGLRPVAFATSATWLIRHWLKDITCLSQQTYAILVANCLRVGSSTAKHFTFRLGAPSPKQKMGLGWAHSSAFAPGAENSSYVTVAFVDIYRVGQKSKLLYCGRYFKG